MWYCHSVDISVALFCLQLYKREFAIKKNVAAALITSPTHTPLRLILLKWPRTWSDAADGDLSTAPALSRIIERTISLISCKWPFSVPVRQTAIDLNAQLPSPITSTDCKPSTANRSSTNSLRAKITSEGKVVARIKALAIVASELHESLAPSAASFDQGHLGPRSKRFLSTEQMKRKTLKYPAHVETLVEMRSYHSIEY